MAKKHNYFNLDFLDKIALKYWRRWLILLFLGIFLTVSIAPVLSQATGQEYFNQGEINYQEGLYEEAAKNLQQAIEMFSAQDKELEVAIALTNLGKSQLALGKVKEAFYSWEDAEKIYAKLGNEAGKVESKILAAKALKNLGFYPKSCQKIIEALQIDILNCEELTQEILKSESKRILAKNDPVYLDGWRNLGDILREMGILEQSQLVLELLVNKNLLASEKAATFLSLGNTYRVMGNLKRDRLSSPNYDYIPWRCEVNNSYNELDISDYEQALSYYQQAEVKPIKTKAQLNRLSLLLAMGKFSEAAELLKAINLDEIPLSRARVYARINYAKILACLQQNNAAIDQIVEQMKIATKEAEYLEDKRIKAYVLGNWGGLNEYLAWLLATNEELVNQDVCQTAEECYEIAKKWTEQALYLAQDAPDISYEYSWQLGRILAAKGEEEKAITAYDNAAKSLESVRKDLLTIDSNVQFSIWNKVEPLYRQLVSLLLTTDASKSEDNLWKSINYVESQQIAELQNFLRCDPEFLTTNQRIYQAEDPITVLKERVEQIFKADPNAALIYPILLEDSLDIIVALPGQPLRHEVTKLSKNEFESTVKNLREYLLTPIQNNDAEILFSEIYDWLIKPFAEELAGVKTLVFVLDSFFQNIPMAALYDGKEYLIEKYGIAIVPSLQLLDSSQPTSREQINALIAGITDAPSFQEEGLAPLPNVGREIEDINNEIQTGETLFGQEFIQSNVEKQLNSNNFSIVHIATHGNFSSNPEDTYILDWNEKIKVKDFDNLLQLNIDNESKPVELLILSACQTATGDRRAALGLAGVAIKAGARSTLATLWQVNDASTAEFMQQFYQELKNPQLTKAEAVRQAQLALLKNYPDTDYNRFYYWAPFVIIGNWL